MSTLTETYFNYATV